MKTTNTYLTDLVAMPENLTVENVTVPALMVAIDDFLKRAIKLTGIDVEQLNSYSMFTTHLYGLWGNPEKLFVKGLDDPNFRDSHYALVSNSAANRIVEFASKHNYDYMDPETMIKYFIVEYVDWFDKIVVGTTKCVEARKVGRFVMDIYREDPSVIDQISTVFDHDVKTLYNAACVVAYAWDIASRDADERPVHAKMVNDMIATFIRAEDIELLESVYKK